jgi:hypothetical protein
MSRPMTWLGLGIPFLVFLLIVTLIVLSAAAGGS